MSRRTSTCIAGSLLASTLLLAVSSSYAGEVTAQACEDDPWYCQRAPIAYQGIDELPVEFNFDTGWVPPSSPLQVHLWGKVFARTSVKLRGELHTTWPESLTLAAPGTPMGGELGYHYGVDIGAQGKITITIVGQGFSWTGDLPYVPKVDFQVVGEESFDAWGWDPGHTISDSSMPVRVAEVDLVGIVTNIPGISGGFELDVAIDAEVTYINDAIVVKHGDGLAVQGGDIIAADDDTNADYHGGPNAVYDVHPEGRVLYGGVLHLIPAFYIKVLGNTTSIPIADIPITLPVTEREWVFDDERVTVPLPDLQLGADELDFGVVKLGQTEWLTYPLENAGDMPVTMEISVNDAHNFLSFHDEIDLDPGESMDAAIAFIPLEAGAIDATLTVASSDPDEPVQTLALRGDGIIDPPIIAHGNAAASPNAEGGCGCRLTPNHDSGGGWALFCLGLALAALRKRCSRRRERRAA
jgi:hypothetical protein